MVKTLGIKDVSKLTGIGLSNLYRLARAEEIPCLRVGNKYIFTEESVEQWLTEQVENHGKFVEK